MADTAEESVVQKGEELQEKDDVKGDEEKIDENKVDQRTDIITENELSKITDDENLGQEPEQATESNKFDYSASLMQSSIYQDASISRPGDEIVIDPRIIEQLTNGVVDQFLPSLKKAQSTIGQIKDSQQVLIDTVVQENCKFQECNAISRLEQTMAKAKVYQNKLLKLRKEMTALHEKSAKLKRRAVKLQQQKQKEEMSKAQMMEREYEREKMLTARVATEPPAS